MRSLKFLTYLLICFLLFVFTTCEPSPKYSFKVARLDSTIRPTKIAISKLAKDYKMYHGEYIETSGIFYSAFEQFAIFTKKHSGGSRAFWLDTNRGLKINSDLFEKMNGNTIHIKGRIDTTRTGHMDQYLATIEEIYFWEK